MTNQRENSGILFRNNRKTNDKHPDYEGCCTIGGKPLRIGAWIKEGKAGKFMSLAFSEPRPAQQESGGQTQETTPF